MKRPNKMKFIFIDNTRLDEYNESCSMEKSWYTKGDFEEQIDMEQYYYMCKEFAMAMGFSEKTVTEWFDNC